MSTTNNNAKTIPPNLNTKNHRGTIKTANMTSSWWILLALMILAPHHMARAAVEIGENATTTEAEDEDYYHDDPRIIEWEVARDLWFNRTQGMPSDYLYEYEESKYGDVPATRGSYVVEVESDVIVKVTSRRRNSGFALSPASFPTIPDIFIMIEEAIYSNQTEVQAEYDGTYGYPTLVVLEENDGTTTTRLAIPSLTPYTILEEELAIQRTFWESYNTTLYSYTMEVSCFCIPEYTTPKRITVENDVLQSTIDIASGEPSEYDDYQTIPQLFQSITDAIHLRYVQINVDYDPEYGYPARISTSPEYDLPDVGSLVTVKDLEWMA